MLTWFWTRAFKPATLQQTYAWWQDTELLRVVIRPSSDFEAMFGWLPCMRHCETFGPCPRLFPMCSKEPCEILLRFWKGKNTLTCPNCYGLRIAPTLNDVHANRDPHERLHSVIEAISVIETTLRSYSSYSRKGASWYIIHDVFDLVFAGSMSGPLQC